MSVQRDEKRLCTEKTTQFLDCNARVDLETTLSRMSSTAQAWQKLLACEYMTLEMSLTVPNFKNPAPQKKVLQLVLNETHPRLHQAGVRSTSGFCVAVEVGVSLQSLSVHDVCSAACDWGAERQSGGQILYLKQINRFHLKRPASINYRQTHTPSPKTHLN